MKYIPCSPSFTRSLQLCYFVFYVKCGITTILLGNVTLHVKVRYKLKTFSMITWLLFFRVKLFVCFLRKMKEKWRCRVIPSLCMMHHPCLTSVYGIYVVTPQFKFIIFFKYFEQYEIHLACDSKYSS